MGCRISPEAHVPGSGKEFNGVTCLAWRTWRFNLLEGALAWRLQTAAMGVKGGMTLEVSTPALLFPAISLLFLSYTNRFLHLSALIRKLHGEWLERGDCMARKQIDNLRRRLVLIRGMNCSEQSVYCCASWQWWQ